MNIRTFSPSISEGEAASKSREKLSLIANGRFSFADSDRRYFQYTFFAANEKRFGRAMRKREMVGGEVGEFEM